MENPRGSFIPKYAMDFVAKSRSVRQMVTRTGLRRGSVVTPTVSTEIRASDQLVCNLALQQISIAYFGFILNQVTDLPQSSKQT